MSTTLTSDDQDYLRKLGAWFYGSEPGNVTPELGDVLGKMLDAAREASSALDWVPRPTATPPGLAWVLSQGVKAVWRSQTNDGKRVYQIVRTAVAYKWRSAYEMAQMGL